MAKVSLQTHAAPLDDFGRGALYETTEKSVDEIICRVYSSSTNDIAINEVRHRLFQVIKIL